MPYEPIRAFGSEFEAYRYYLHTEVYPAQRRAKIRRFLIGASMMTIAMGIVALLVIIAIFR